MKKRILPKLIIALVALALSFTMLGVLTACPTTDSGGNDPIPVASITLSQTGTVNLNVGNTLPVVATVAPANAANQNINWGSNNPTVASVSAGVVTAVSPGQAVITATSVMNPQVSATVTVVVTPAGVTAGVTDMLLTASETTLASGEAVVLTASTSPYGSDSRITWSQYPANRLINMTAAGTAGTITVTAGPVGGPVTVTARAVGNTAIYRTVTINIEAPGIDLSGTTASPHPLRLYERDTTATLTAAFTNIPANQMENVVWTVAPANIVTIATVASNYAARVIAPIGLGTATVTATLPAEGTRGEVTASASFVVTGLQPGTAANPTVITTPGQFLAMPMSGHFRLGNSLDFTGIPVTHPAMTLGTEANPFTGTFDGAGHTLNNIHVVATVAYSWMAGIWARTDGATIRNLGIDGVSMLTTGTGVGGGALHGMLIGRADNTTLENIFVRASVHGIAQWGGAWRTAYWPVANFFAGERSGALIGQIDSGYATDTRNTRLTNVVLDVTSLDGFGAAISAMNNSTQPFTNVFIVDNGHSRNSYMENNAGTTRYDYGTFFHGGLSYAVTAGITLVPRNMVQAVDEDDEPMYDEDDEPIMVRQPGLAGINTTGINFAPLATGVGAGVWNITSAFPTLIPQA